MSYTIVGYGFPSLCFPLFREGFPTLEHAKRVATLEHANGWRLVEIIKIEPSSESYFGIKRTHIESVGAY